MKDMKGGGKDGQKKGLEERTKFLSVRGIDPVSSISYRLINFIVSDDTCWTQGFCGCFDEHASNARKRTDPVCWSLEF